jgi:hypothetical protein
MQAVAKRNANTNVSPDSGQGDAPAGVTRCRKISFKAKTIAFLLATLSLSWFFEGWRQINSTANLGGWAIFALGIVSTLLTVGIWAYWIYIEEKSKGTLRKRIGLFESIERSLGSKEE